jgi:RNA polymerase sigma factor (sigma-70 family)
LIISKNIIEACKKNDRSSQKIVYEKFFDRMFAVCRRYVRNDEETPEVLNDGFISVFQNIHQYKGEGSFEGWIRKIMVNKALDYLRTNKKYKETLQYVDNYKEEPSFVDAEIISSCNIDELYDLIQNLPTVYRMVFNLYAIEGFSHKEIAEKIGISENTSRWYLSESRKKLKEKLTVSIYQL